MCDVNQRGEMFLIEALLKKEIRLRKLQTNGTYFLCKYLVLTSLLLPDIDGEGREGDRFEETNNFKLFYNEKNPNRYVSFSLMHKEYFPSVIYCLALAIFATCCFFSILICLSAANQSRHREI